MTNLQPEPGITGLYFAEPNTTHAVQATDHGYDVYRLPEDVFGSEPFASVPTFRLALAVVREDRRRQWYGRQEVK